MESRLYRGHVGHGRLTPVSHHFRYSLFFLFTLLPPLERTTQP